MRVDVQTAFGIGNFDLIKQFQDAFAYCITTQAQMLL